MNTQPPTTAVMLEFLHSIMTTEQLREVMAARRTPTSGVISRSAASVIQELYEEKQPKQPTPRKVLK